MIRDSILDTELAEPAIGEAKATTGSSHRFCRALQSLRSPTFDIREIFGAPRFSTFSTVSARSSHSLEVRATRYSHEPDTQQSHG
jgi:hypothetical protein